MRFHAEHRFPGPPDAVARVLADTAFYESLELPDVTLLEVRRSDAPTVGDAPGAGVLVRYEFSGSLDAMVRRLLGGARLTWTQELRLGDARTGLLTFAAEANPRLLHGSAAFVLEAPDERRPGDASPPGRSGPSSAVSTGGEQATVRRLDGALTVAVPGIGGMAERRIVPGIVHRLDLEAEAVRQRLVGAD